ncbi:hypothetical protein AB4560_09700 [Vibrio sp. 10N.222.51.C12]|uniref:hypothetical protein n=1 Tax=Vibrio sp. 10N.222.51.C12 TaxID=3229622 RepID=UPI003550438E
MKKRSTGAVKREAKPREAFDLSWLKLNYQGSNVDLSRLYFHSANLDLPKIEGRAQYVNKIAKAIQDKVNLARSENTYAMAVINFFRYTKYCDANGFNPFSKEGYLSYVGGDGELRRKIKINEDRPPFLMQGEHGDELGLSEGTCEDHCHDIRTILKLAEVHQPTWERAFENFSNKEAKLTIPYNSDETELSIKLLLRAFDALYEALSTHYKKSPSNSLPKTIEVELGGGLGKLILPELGITTSPFNVCMAAGYALFAYYTGLNRDVALNAAHPIQFEKRKLKDKTISQISLSLWKARAGKFVKSELTDDMPVFDFSDNEFDVEIEKKTGVSLVRKLVKLAEMFGSTTERSPLLFSLDANGKVTKFNQLSVLRLPSVLGLKALNTERLSPIFADGLAMALKNKFYHVTSDSQEDGSQRLSKRVVPLGHSAQRNVVSCASLLLTGYNAPQAFYGACIPLEVSEDGEYHRYQFTSYTGIQGEFVLPKTFRGVLKSLELWAAAVPDNNEGFLLPFPTRKGIHTFVWTTPERLPSMHTVLRALAIPHGEYYLDINTRRFRALMALEAYSDDDLGEEGSILLDNELNTFQQSYADGNPEENQLIFYESLEIASRIFKGATKEEAIAAIKKLLKRETLTFDEVKKRRIHINQNGIACNGIPDIDKTMGEDHHRGATKTAEKLGIDPKGGMPCYQLDQCSRCKSAKMVDDANQVYKLLSFIEMMESRIDLRPEDESLMDTATYLRIMIDENISDEVLAEANKTLYLNGLHPLVEKMQAAQILA